MNGLILKLWLCIAIVASVSVMSQAAFAFNPLANSCARGSNSSSDVCEDNQKQNGSSNNPINSTIQKAAALVAVIAGIVGVVMLILGGISYMTANGDQQKVATAQRRILGAVIGLVIAALAGVIAGFVVNKFVN